MTAVVLGATGFIGQQLVDLLLHDSYFSKVRILVRRDIQLSHPKLEVQVVDFNELNDYISKLGTGDIIFCCIGTTLATVKGDKVAYRKIDYDIAVNAAKMGKDAGFTSYLLVSAVGANAGSSNFYLRLKGEIEHDISSLEYHAFHVFRPSVLLGNRKEFRLMETIGQVALRLLKPLMVGGVKKYRGIDGRVVAKAMVAAAKGGAPGMVVHHWEDMERLARSYTAVE